MNWIDVNKEIPNDNRIVLVWLERGIFTRAYYDRLVPEREGWRIVEVAYRTEKITHWKDIESPK